MIGIEEDENINIKNRQVSNSFAAFEKPAREKLFLLRQLILETASEIGLDDTLEETLKWGEPSYISQSGSTIRIAPYKRDKAKVAMFFNCKTILIETIKEVYEDVFEYEGNRALLLFIDKDIPRSELKHCIELALTYHKIKKLPLLGC